jgi:hypothetical protein
MGPSDEDWLIVRKIHPAGGPSLWTMVLGERSPATIPEATAAVACTRRATSAVGMRRCHDQHEAGSSAHGGRARSPDLEEVDRSQQRHEVRLADPAEAQAAGAAAPCGRPSVRHGQVCTRAPESLRVRTRVEEQGQERHQLAADECRAERHELPRGGYVQCGTVRGRRKQCVSLTSIDRKRESAAATGAAPVSDNHTEQRAEQRGAVHEPSRDSEIAAPLCAGAHTGRKAPTMAVAPTALITSD